MSPERPGWFAVEAFAPPGTRYRFVLDDGARVPDPASRSQADDALGWSLVADPLRYHWRFPRFVGPPWSEAVLYEIHVGTFTPEGTYAAAATRLPHLADLGVTMVELMPLATFAGRRGWGYDGVLLFAPHPDYGAPDDLKAFIDAAHGFGISVMLDVVYNHFGPVGNVLPRLAPIFTDRHRTPWGDGLDLDGAASREVRRLVIDNALYWLAEYRFDGLRLDAVHALRDDSQVHLLHELAGRIHAEIRDRPVRLVVENGDNDPGLLAPGLFDAQWNDDLHHGLHVTVTGEGGGYYADYLEAETSERPALARAVAEGFVRRGEGGPSPLADEPVSAELPPQSFVAFLQNHDQIGNRPFGDRLSATVEPGPLRAATAIVMLGPQIPLMFMGDEWAATAPFPFFGEFAGEVADMVRDGRRAEFDGIAGFGDAAVEIPDPASEETFASARLDWSEWDREPHRERLHWTRRILEVRRAEVAPLIPRIAGGGRFLRHGPGRFDVAWTVEEGGRLVLEANLAADPSDRGGVAGSRSIWIEGTATSGRLGPWSVAVSVDDPRPQAQRDASTVRSSASDRTASGSFVPV
jgi:maltooligosyltrehalose trehalohydrolase